MEQFGVQIIPINFAIIEQRMSAVLEEKPTEMKEIEEYIRMHYKLDDLNLMALI